MNFKTTVLFALLASASSASWSINLLQSYQAALTEDATYQAARASADAGREALPQARAQMLPSVTASFSRNSNKLSNTAPDFLGRLTTTDFNYPSHGETLTARQPLYRKYIWESYRQAQVQMDDVEAALSAELQNLAVKVSAAYFDALLAEEQHSLVKNQVAIQTTQLEAARKLFAGGNGTRTDIDDVQSRLDMSLAMELEARQSVSYTRRQLQVMLNQPIDTLAPVDPSRLVLAPPQPDSLEHWTALAEANSPEMRALRARLEVATLDIKKAQSGHTPTLDAVAQWARSASENTQNTQSSTDLRSIGLQLTIPLYAGGGVNSSVRQALAAKERAAQQLEAARRDLGLRVQREFRGVSEGLLKVKALEQAVRSAEQAVLSSQKSFQGGTRTRLDILNAENNRMTSLRDLTQARHSYLLSHLRLQAMVNEANIKAIENMNAYLKVQ